MAQPIPTLDPITIGQVTNGEWAAYVQLVDDFTQDISTAIHNINPAIQVEAPPLVYDANPNNATGRLNAAQQAMAWMYCLQAQHTPLIAQQTQQTAIANALLQQQQQQPPLPPHQEILKSAIEPHSKKAL
jgi:hypothetical protein